MSNPIPVGVLLAAGIVLKFFPGSCFTVAKPNFVIMLYCLASLMVLTPELLILDKPTAGLDWRECMHTLHLVQDLCKNQDTTVFMVSPDMKIVQDFDQQGKNRRQRHTARSAAQCASAAKGRAAAAGHAAEPVARRRLYRMQDVERPET